MTPLAKAPRHHGSHAGLLFWPTDPMQLKSIDAIIVPTIRNAIVLSGALFQGLALDCPVVVLCSRWAKAPEAATLARQIGAQIIAIDVNATTMRLPALATSKLLRSSYPEFHRHSDLSLKRNLGLTLARMAGWQRVVFLDDDMLDLEYRSLMLAASHLDTHDVVGLSNEGFPDNSVVCHALRAVRQKVGILQLSFVGGGAMAVATQRSDSFFPEIYNEDWFFMMGGFTQQSGQRIAVAGKVAQQAYDPFVNPERARSEEFGDCLAEGLYSLLDDGASLALAADYDYWHHFLLDRQVLLRRTREAISSTEMVPHKRGAMLASITAAQGRNRIITPRMCVDFLDAWRKDQQAWQAFLQCLPVNRSIVDACNFLRYDRTEQPR